MSKKITFVVTLLLLLLITIKVSWSAPDPSTLQAQQKAASAAAEWLITIHQNDDGGYTSFSTGANAQPSDLSGTLDAVLALTSAGYDLQTPYPGKTSTPFAYLANNGEALFAYAQTDGSAAGKVVLALLALKQDPRTFAGHDFVTALQGTLAEDGSFTVTAPFQQALAILGLSAAGEQVPAEAATWLVSRQSVEEGFAGSWDDGFGTLGNADATAMSLMALTSAGIVPDDAIVEAIAAATIYLTSSQTETGGWEYGPGFGANVNSTALVIQALTRLGQDIATPMAYLLANQSTSGAFQADFGNGPTDDFYATVQALPALGAGIPLPTATTAPTAYVAAATPAPTSEPTAYVPPTVAPQATVNTLGTDRPTPTPGADVAPPLIEPADSGTPIVAYMGGLIVVVLGLGGFFYLRRRAS